MFIPDLGSEIPDPNFSHPGSRIRIKEFNYSNQKNCLKALGNMIRFVHPGSGSRFVTIPDPGVKKAPDPGSGFATLVLRQTHACSDKLMKYCCSLNFFPSRI